MRLSRTRRHWDKFARADPLWAVLTDDGKRGNQWRIDEFFRTGVESVDAIIRDVQVRHPALRPGTALDFGCGVGRLTQALARHFARVTGVDISAEMLQHARHHNRHGTRVDYVLNPGDNLGRFADGSFDFVLSLITLQHMEPVYARRYIAEFVRVAAPGGVILFQLPAAIERIATPPRPFTLRPDTLVRRLVRDLRRKFFSGPVMEMHAIPRAEVEALLSGAGATLIVCLPHDAGKQVLQSWMYLARKP